MKIQSKHHDNPALLRRLVAVTALLACGCVSATSPAAASAHADVIVSLLSDAKTAKHMIHLSDVAEVQTGDGRLRESLLALDLAEFPENQSNLQIGREFVVLRVKLALPGSQQVNVVGAESIRISRPLEHNNDEFVVQQIRTELAAIWNVDEPSVTVKLMNPLSERFRQRTLTEHDLDMVVPPTTLPGSLRIRLLLRDQGRLTTAENVSIAANCFCNVIVARKDLNRDQVIAKDDLQIELQSVRRPQPEQDIEEFVGLAVRSTIRKGQKIDKRYLSQARSQKTASVVKPRDIVSLVARKGGITVTVADAEVLSAGGIGDQVRVRNPRSRKTVSARVVDSGQVEVLLR